MSKISDKTTSFC